MINFAPTHGAYDAPCQTASHRKKFFVNAIIEVHKLHKSYAGQRVVDDLSLSIRRGECYGLLGPNGAGKTTTLRLLLGLTRSDGGTSGCSTMPCHPCGEARLRLGVVPQIDNLDPDFTVAENLWCMAAISA